MRQQFIPHSTCLLLLFSLGFATTEVYCLEGVYDGRIEGRQILTPASPAEPRITSAPIFGVRPGKLIRFRVSATGEKPLKYSATGLPAGVSVDPVSGWITGRAPEKAGDENDERETET